MHVKRLITLCTLTLAGTAALADDITIDPMNHVSMRSRADLKTEVTRARAEGTLLAAGEMIPVMPRAVMSARNREDVRAEARYAARHWQSGEVAIGG